jgi:pyruvate dehydrogenase E2 component (dihydrolipoamide acetyltransferase)
MAEIVPMPKLGFDMAEGTLVRWVVNEGEKVSKGDVLAEIETDKATVEVESAHEGVVARHLVEAGTSVPIGDPIAVIGAEGEQVDVKQLLGEIAPEAETGLKPGAPTEEQEALPRETAVDEAAPEQETQEREAAPRRPEAEKTEAESAGEDGHLPGGVRVSPIARRIAEESGVDLREVEGSGPQGRIVKKDVEDFLEEKPEAEPAAAAAPAPPAPAPISERKPAQPQPVFAPTGAPQPDQAVPVSRLRAVIGRRMTESKQQVPHFYVTHEYELDLLMAMRKEINAILPEGEKLSVNDFILKATALTLRQFPNINASIKGNEIIHHGQVNIGVAVAVEGGLLTVVCRDADRKSLRQISSEVRTMAGRARDGKVKPEDIEGSTFSVSNLGMFDVENFAAIINPPEAGILAIGSAREIPVVKDGEIKISWRMKATISIDHRVSDGAEAARYMQALATYLEQPLLLMA